MEKLLTQHPEQKWEHQGPARLAPGQPLSCLLPGLPGALLTFSPFQSVGDSFGGTILTFSPFQSVGDKFGGTLSSCLGYLMTEFLPQSFGYLFLDAKLSLPSQSSPFLY